jgi:phage-related protein
VQKWKIVYYEESNGKCPVLDFINSLKVANQAKVTSWLSLLEEKGPVLPRPYADVLRNGIHELRIKLSGNQVRILYFFYFKDFIVLTNSFVKTTSKVPEKQMRISETSREDFLARYSEERLQEEYDENL